MGPEWESNQGHRDFQDENLKFIYQLNQPFTGTPDANYVPLWATVNNCCPQNSRMVDSTAHLVNKVLPKHPVRQWLMCLQTLEIPLKEKPQSLDDEVVPRI
jgi:hypothetical protein